MARKTREQETTVVSDNVEQIVPSVENVGSETIAPASDVLVTENVATDVSNEARMQEELLAIEASKQRQLNPTAPKSDAATSLLLVQLREMREEMSRMRAESAQQAEKTAQAIAAQPTRKQSAGNGKDHYNMRRSGLPSQMNHYIAKMNADGHEPSVEEIAVACSNRRDLTKRHCDHLMKNHGASATATGWRLKTEDIPFFTK